LKKHPYTHRTRKTTTQIRGLIRGLFKNAVVADIELTALDEAAEIAVYIDARPGFIGGRGLVDLRVNDQGDYRQVEVVALATTFADNVAMGFAHDVSGIRELGTSKKMARAIIEALG
jgi:hypothetical protein